MDTALVMAADRIAGHNHGLLDGVAFAHTFQLVGTCPLPREGDSGREGC
jgi:hypothetical protein